MEKLSLTAAKRSIVGHKVKKLRKEGVLPANLYGKKITSCSIQVPEKEFLLLFAKAGETGLIELTIDGEKHPVLIHNIQYHPVTSRPLHVDFHRVDLKEKVVAKVPLAITAEAPAVKDKVGTLLQLLSEVEVEALPSDLLDKIEVDVGNLTAVDQSIKVAELKVDNKIKVLTDANLEIVKIAPLVSKEAEEMAKEETEAAEIASAQAAPPPEEEAEKKEVKPAEETTSKPASDKTSDKSEKKE